MREANAKPFAVWGERSNVETFLSRILRHRCLFQLLVLGVPAGTLVLKGFSRLSEDLFDRRAVVDFQPFPAGDIQPMWIKAETV